jgi:hypothetical protein
VNTRALCFSFSPSTTIGTHLGDANLVCGVDFVALAENVDVPLGIALGIVVVRAVEPDLVILADRRDGVVVCLAELDLLKVGEDALY